MLVLWYQLTIRLLSVRAPKWSKHLMGRKGGCLPGGCCRPATAAILEEVMKLPPPAYACASSVGSMPHSLGVLRSSCSDCGRILRPDSEEDLGDQRQEANRVFHVMCALWLPWEPRQLLEAVVGSMLSPLTVRSLP